MDAVLQRTILTRHNSQRNVLAMGGADDFKRPAAADMATMVNQLLFKAKIPITPTRDSIQPFYYYVNIRNVLLHQFISNGMTNWN